jgi:hypothetical protein
MPEPVDAPSPSEAAAEGGVIEPTSTPLAADAPN